MWIGRQLAHFVKVVINKISSLTFLFFYSQDDSVEGRRGCYLWLSGVSQRREGGSLYRVVGR